MADFKVLVAVDGSPLSEASLRYLPFLKALGDLRVRLVSVVETYGDAEGLAGASEHFERETRLLAAYADRIAEEQAKRLGVPVEAQVKLGPADERIAESAAEFGADVLLMTTHGRAGIGRWAIGSVADKVLRSSHVPVLVIGPQAAQVESPRPITGILAPVDGSELAEHALPVASRWAQAMSARLHLVRVVSIPAVTYEPGAAAAVPDLLTVMEESARTYLERVADKAKAREVVTDLLIGATADQLIEYSTENGIGLVVMTTRGRRGLLRAVLGSVTDRMLHGPAPVLVLPAD